jgi:hypothetical protein
MRVIVAQPAQRAIFEGEGAPLKVGVLRWTAYVTQPPELADRIGPSKSTAVSVIAKATFSYADCASAAEPAVLALEPEPMSLEQASDLQGAADDELWYSSDFVPFKVGCDVLLTGHAFSDRPVGEIKAAIRIGDVQRSFFARAPAPVVRIPLVRANIKGEDGVTPDAVGPRETPAVPEEHAEGFDFSAYNSAPRSQRVATISPGSVIELEGLSARAGRQVIQLPGLAPRAYGDSPGFRGRPIELRCDTLWIDTDRELVVMVWRGVVEVNDEIGELERVTISLERADKPRDLAAITKDLARGSFDHAVEPQDLEGDEEGKAPPESGEVLLAKYEAWDQTPEPTITLERYAQVSAELGEGREDRKDCLKRHGLDEDGWGLEERAWLERMGDAAMSGDAALATRYGDLFIAAQDKLARPEEGRETIDEYAALKVEMEESGDPTKVLRDRSMTLAQWMRLDRRWMRDALADKKLKTEIDRRVEAYRIRYGRRLRGEE